MHPEPGGGGGAQRASGCCRRNPPFCPGRRPAGRAALSGIPAGAAARRQGAAVPGTARLPSPLPPPPPQGRRRAAAAACTGIRRAPPLLHPAAARCIFNQFDRAGRHRAAAVYIKRIQRAAVAQTKPQVNIENVVASASVGQAIDLKVVHKKFPDAEYNPEQFPGLVFRIAKPKTATLIFRTGNMVCTGAKSEEMAVEAVRIVVKRLRKRGVRIKKDAVVAVQNIVAAINLHGTIQIERAARVLPRSMYEPEQFPGLIHRMVDPKTVILLFASGKLVCTGAKRETDVYRSVHGLHALLEEKNLMVYA